MAIGDGGGLGGLNLSVGIGINLTGQEQLTSVAKALELIAQMAQKTEQVINQMGNSMNNTFAGISSGAAKAAGEIERMQHAASRPGTGTPGFVRPPVSLPESQRMAAPATGLMQQQIGRATSKMEQDRRANETAMRDELVAREQLTNNLKSGIMGGLGLTAAIGATELVRTGMHAVGQLDERIAAMRLTGHGQEEIDRDVMSAARTPVHGVNMAERMFLSQEISGIVGREVSPSTSRDIAILSRAAARISGETGDITGVTRNMLRAGESLGNFTNPKTGELDEGLLEKNVLTVEKMIAVSQGLVKPETMMHNARIGMSSLQSLDLANNSLAASRFAVLNEDLGERAGDTLNAMRRVSTAPVEAGSEAASLRMKFGEFNLAGMRPLPKIGGKANLMDFGGIPGSGDWLQNLIESHQKVLQTVRQENPQFSKQKVEQEALAIETKMHGERAARGITSLASETGLERVEKTLLRYKQLGASVEEVDKASRNFNDALSAVKASFEDLVTSTAKVGGLTNALYGLSDAMARATLFLREHPGLATFITDIGMALAGLLALRLAIAALGRIAMLAGMQTRAGAMAGGVVGGVVREGAIGAAARTGTAGLTGMPMVVSSLKSGLSAMATRGTAAMIVGGVANAVADSMLDTDTAKIASDAIEGAGVGFAFGNIPGAIIGAISSVALKAALAHPSLRPEDIPSEADRKADRERRLEDLISRQAQPRAEQSGPPAPGGLLAFLDDPIGLKAQREARIKERQAEAPAAKPPEELVPYGANESSRPLLSYLPGFSQLYQSAQEARAAEAAQYAREQLAPIQDDRRELSTIRGVQSMRPSMSSDTSTAAGARRSLTHAPHPMHIDIPQSNAIQRLQQDERIYQQQRAQQPNLNLVTGSTGKVPVPSPMGSISATTPTTAPQVQTAIPSVGQPATATTPTLNVGTIIAGSLIVNSLNQSLATPTLALTSGGSPGGTGGGTPTPGVPSSAIAQFNRRRDQALAPMLASGEPMPKPLSNPTAQQLHDFPAPAHTPASRGRWPIGIHGSGAVPIDAPSGAMAPRGLTSFGAPRTADTSMSAGAKTVLDAIAGGEAGRKGYLAQNPGSTAHGRLQFINSTDQIISKRTGLFGNDPVSQDKKGLELASSEYKRLTHGRDLATDANNPAYDGLITQALKATWPSLPGGSQQNTSMETFRARMQSGRELYAHEGVPLPGAMQHIQSERNFVPPSLMGPQINPEQADMPAQQTSVHVHSPTYLDGELIADHVGQHIIGGGSTASSSSTSFDTKMHPLAPGTSISRW